MTLRRVRRRCWSLIRALNLPTPFDLSMLCDALSARSGRPIRLLPMPLDIDGPCGLWVATSEADYVVVQRDTTGPHRNHIVAHELAHQVLEHDAIQVLSDDAARMLMPHLDKSAVTRLIGRTRYSTDAELEAEVLASLLIERGGQWFPSRAKLEIPSEVSGVVARLSRSLDGGGRRKDVSVPVVKPPPSYRQRPRMRRA